jgi:hypothetical protein
LWQAPKPSSKEKARKLHPSIVEISSKYSLMQTRWLKTIARKIGQRIFSLHSS